MLNKTKGYLFEPSLQDKRKYLDILHEYVEIHATIGDAENKSHIPDYVINHGVLNTKQLYDLLQESKVRIKLFFFQNIFTDVDGAIVWVILQVIASSRYLDFYDGRFLTLEESHALKNVTCLFGRPVVQHVTRQKRVHC